MCGILYKITRTETYKIHNSLTPKKQLQWYARNILLLRESIYPFNLNLKTVLDLSFAGLGAQCLYQLYLDQKILS